MVFAMLVAISGFVAERFGRFDGNRVIPSLALPEQIVPSTVDVMASERSQNSKLPSSEVEPATALEEFSTAIAALRNESGESHYKAAKMLQRVCENAAEHPDEDKYRRIRCSNPAFVKHLDRFEASRACLTTVGFREETTADGTEQLMLPRERVSRPLLSAVSALLKGELRMLDVQSGGPPRCGRRCLPPRPRSRCGPRCSTRSRSSSRQRTCRRCSSTATTRSA